MTTIIMTGGTSGLGEIAAQCLSKDRNVRLILGARGAASKSGEALPLDLTNLESVRSFASTVNDLLGKSEINALAINAGVAPPTDETRTPHGFETAFQVNHLSQYLLLRLLMPRLARGATIVITTSGTHDPANKTMAPPPRHANAGHLAHPKRDPERDNPGRAYASSKLCNILTARALAAQPESRERQFVVVAYDRSEERRVGKECRL